MKIPTPSTENEQIPDPILPLQDPPFIWYVQFALKIHACIFLSFSHVSFVKWTAQFVRILITIIFISTVRSFQLYKTDINKMNSIYKLQKICLQMKEMWDFP